MGRRRARPDKGSALPRYDGSTSCQDWRIGLTPVRADVVAAMLWTGDRLVHHARGTEAAMCAIARRWISIAAENGNLASN
ncbi:hypothetical protein ABZU76_13420 [Amycolatopsis sp. NPDC005232]|uniref:hypothetical protein n=1 Tax=Amycolatopsis sp. NPDC005232 TaxID=3157027 RepID=UPI0033BCE7AA